LDATIASIPPRLLEIIKDATAADRTAAGLRRDTQTHLLGPEPPWL